jgi:hypothetical protein
MRHSAPMRPTARIADSFARGTQRRNFMFSAWRRNTAQGAKENLSISQRLKKLSREYGWSAVGVYFALSVLDFPFCFLFVRLVGTERIGTFALCSHDAPFIFSFHKSKFYNAILT